MNNSHLQQRRVQAVVLDVDNTLTPPREPLELEMAGALQQLSIPFFLNAGGDLRLVNEQFIEPFHSFGYRGCFDAFLCNGSIRYRCELDDSIRVTMVRDFNIRDYLGVARFHELMRVLVSTLDSEEFRLEPSMKVIGERIIDRVSMINVAPIGRPRERLTEEAHQNRRAFKEFDDRTNFRSRFLAQLNSKLRELVADGLHISLGGQTSFDIVIKGNDKSLALKSVLEEGFERIAYIGDALFPGGNDEAVVQFIAQWRSIDRCPVQAIQVNCWRDTVDVFKKLAILNGLGR